MPAWRSNTLSLRHNMLIKPRTFSVGIRTGLKNGHFCPPRCNSLSRTVKAWKSCLELPWQYSIFELRHFIIFETSSTRGNDPPGKRPSFDRGHALAMSRQMIEANDSEKGKTPVMKTTRDFRIGDCLVQSRLNRIVVAGHVKQIEPKAMRVLLHLATNAGEVVSKRELIREVWRDVHVTEHVVTRSIFLLRRALGDTDPRKRIIETIPKAGYRLLESVRIVSRKPKKLRLYL